LDETKVLDWYKEQVKALTSNVTADPVAVPGEGPGAGQVVVPLVAQYNQLVELYDTVNKEMVSKGNTEAGQQFLLVIQAKSEDLRDQIQILTADVFGMLATLVEIIKGEGGVFEFSAIGMQYIDQAVSAAVVLIGETEVQLQPTAEESQAAQDAADKLADLIKKAKEALGWAYGMIEGLKAYADSIDLEFSDGTQDRIAELKVKIEDEFPKEKESNWWLLLLAAAAAAASQRK
jgi:hypothetical protein